MLISTKGRYAVRVMLELADREKDAYVTLNEIAAEQGISEKYLESIVAALVKAGLVSGVRGKGGGYRLSRAAEEYTLYEILSVSEGSISPVSCLECKPNPCARAGRCATLPVWERLQNVIDDYLKSVTLADVFAEGKSNDCRLAEGETGACYDSRKKR